MEIREDLDRTSCFARGGLNEPFLVLGSVTGGDKGWLMFCCWGRLLSKLSQNDIDDSWRRQFEELSMNDCRHTQLASFVDQDGPEMSTLVLSQQGLRNYLAVGRREQVNVL